jgi:hypothetical protein
MDSGPAPRGASRNDGRETLSFRDGPKDRTSDAQLRIGESRNSGFALRAPRNDDREKQGGPPSRTATPPSRRALAALHDPLIQFLIHNLHRAINLGIGHAELMRNQFHQQVDPLDERRAACDRAGGR